MALLLVHLTATAALAGLVVPLHTRLGQAYDDAAARRLATTNWLRTAAWTAGTLCAALLVLQADQGPLAS